MLQLTFIYLVQVQKFSLFHYHGKNCKKDPKKEICYILLPWLQELKTILQKDLQQIPFEISSSIPGATAQTSTSDLLEFHFSSLFIPLRNAKADDINSRKTNLLQQNHVIFGLLSRSHYGILHTRVIAVSYRFHVVEPNWMPVPTWDKSFIFLFARSSDIFMWVIFFDFSPTSNRHITCVYRMITVIAKYFQRQHRLEWHI